MAVHTLRDRDENGAKKLKRLICWIHASLGLNESKSKNFLVQKKREYAK